MSAIIESDRQLTVPRTDVGAAVAGTRRSRVGLNAANFFLAEVTGVVMPFLAKFLAARGWRDDSIGLASAVAGLGVCLMQAPAGFLVDRVRQRRVLLAGASLVVGAGYGLLIGFWGLHYALEKIGVTSIPTGSFDSEARVRLVEAKKSGHYKGSSQLELELTSITANGATYPVESGYYTLNGASRGKRTAETVGGGAVLGTLIGAIAGGRKGAAIGAGAGAATGAGVQTVTRGPQVKIPSETKIDFTLKSPVTVK